MNLLALIDVGNTFAHVESGILLGVDTLNTNERCVCPLSTLAAKRDITTRTSNKSMARKAGKSEKVKHTA